MLEHLNLALFTQHVNTRFRMRLDENRFVETELIGAVDLGSTPQQEQFSVTFRGPVEAFLPQSTYLVEHESLGSFALFITAVGRDPQGIQYEAIFNRLIRE